MSLTLLFLSRLFLTPSGLVGLTASLRGADSSFLVLDSVDMLSATLAEGLLPLRPARRLRPGFVSLLPGLAELTGVVMSEVLAGLTRLGETGFGAFVAPPTAGVLAGRTGVVMSEVLAGLTRLGEAGFGAFVAPPTADDGFAALILVAMREVSAVFVRVGELTAGLVFAGSTAGPLAGRTGVATREVLEGLTRVGVVGAGFDGLRAVSATGGLDILRD